MSLQDVLHRRVPVAEIAPLLRSRVLWALVAAILISARYVYGNLDMLAIGGGGTDDMTRLLQVRELAATGNWFDRTLAQIGAPETLYSHWSRLIDLPLLVLTGLFGLFLAGDTSEMIVRVVWPTLLLFGLLFVVLREAEREAGLMAAIAVIVLVAGGASATFQFNPGRVDHHNVQILCAVAGILFLQRSFTDPRMGWWSGGLLGLGLASGLEALLLVGAVVGLAALFSVFVYAARDGVLRTLIACTATAWACLIVTIAPWDWLQPACDELSLNLVLLLSVGTAAYGLLFTRFEYAPAFVWLGGLAIGGALALGAYLGVAPVCAGGPFAMVDPAVKPIWLDKVTEVKSLAAFAKASPSGALSFLACVLMGCAALGWSWSQKRDATALFAFVVMVLATLYSCVYVKLMPYAMWLAIPAVAIAIAGLPGIGEIPARTVRVAAMVFGNQATLLVAIASLAGMFTDVESTAKAKLSATTQRCQNAAYHRELDQLPTGLIANELDLGPFIALNSRHRVVSAPYHRIDKSIIATFEFIKGESAKAEKVLRNLNADYVVVCKRSGAALAKVPKGTMMYALQTGAAPGFLEPVKVGDGASPLMVWRIRK